MERKHFYFNYCRN